MQKVKYQEDGKNRYFIVRKPTSKIVSEAQIESSKMFSKLVKGGGDILFRSQLDEHMVQTGLWDDEKTKRLIELSKEIDNNQKKLASGGIKLSEAKEIALELRVARFRYDNLTSIRNNLDENTVEGQAENVRFDTIAINCILDEQGQPVFDNVYDYRDDTRPHVFEAASKLASLMYNISENPQKDLPENKFLLEYGFVNDNLELVDKDGNLIDSEGNLLEKEEEVKFKPFLDEEGEEVILEKTEIVEEKEEIVEEEGDNAEKKEE